MLQSSSHPVFPTIFDPRQCDQSQKLLLWAKLHLLLFDSLAIQDNFLISKVVAEAREHVSKRSPFCEWIERGWVKVALRNGVYSLSHLKRELAKRAKAGDYNPFEELQPGLELYRSRRFISYLRDLDDCLSTEGAIALWSPEQLGNRLRKNMRSSANNGSSGLPVDRALAIWQHIEGTATDNVHSRTMYYRHAATLPEQEGTLLRNWVTLEYISNLPQALTFDLSMPRRTALSVNVVDPIAPLVGTKQISDSAITAGRDCVLLSSAFLTRLTADDIQRLRSLDEFRDLTEARLSEDPTRLQKCLLAYLRGIAEEAPKIMDPRIERLEAQVSVKRKVAGLSEIAGVVLTISNPVLGPALVACALFLKSKKDTEVMLRERQRKAAIELDSQQSGYLLDFVHDESATL